MFSYFDLITPIGTAILASVLCIYAVTKAKDTALAKKNPGTGRPYWSRCSLLSWSTPTNRGVPGF